MKIDSGISPSVDSAIKNKINSKTADAVVADDNSPSTVINLSENAKKLQDQIKNSHLDEEVRPDAVAEAKSELANWKGLSDQQIDQIMNRMFDEMSL